jgi:hypothetical protein
VVGTEWYGVSAVVTFAWNETNSLEEQSHERYLFESEVEAYEIAGRAGLWGVAVPFAAMDASACALCLTAGNPMPRFTSGIAECPSPFGSWNRVVGYQTSQLYQHGGSLEFE